VEKINILLVGENVNSCSMLAAVLRHQGRYEVMGPATTWAEMCYLLLAHSPRLALVDLESPGQGVLESIRVGRRLSPETRFVGLTDGSGPKEGNLHDLDATLARALPISQTLQTLSRLVEEQPGQESGPTEKPGDQSPPRMAGSSGVALFPKAVGEQRWEPDPSSTPSPIALTAGRSNGGSGGADRWSGDPDGHPEGIIPTFDTINLQVGPFASFRALAAFQNALCRLEGVTRVKVRRFYRGMLYASVQYSGVLPLAERLTALSDFNPKVVADDAGNLHVSIELEGLPEIGAAPRLD